MTDTLNSIWAALSGIFGIGWGAQFLYYRYEKRKREAELKSSEIDVDAKEDATRNAKLAQAYERIVQLQGIADKERDKWVAIAEELSDVKLELLRERELRRVADFDKCTRLACPNRTPPRTNEKTE